VVVVEAAQRSGALITARLAAEAGREVLAVPGSPLDPRSRGANRLIRNGATLIESAEDVLEVLKAIPREARPAARPTGFREETGVPDPIDTTASDDPAAADPGAPRARILEVLSQTPMEQDDLARESGMPVAAVAAVLLELEIEGRLQRLGGQKVALT
jgi:DNA processing protein